MNMAFLLALLIAGCQTKEEPNIQEEVMDEFAIDTVVPVLYSPYSGKEFPVIFSAVYSDSTRIIQNGMTFTFRKINLGNIKITSGKLVACDPGVRKHGKPFTENFPKGEFPVELALAKDTTGEFVAYSRIVFEEGDVARWEYALLPGEDPISIVDSLIYCHGVDASMSMYIDEEANKMIPIENEAAWDSIYVTNMNRSNNTGFIYSAADHNYAAFSTGYGDGCYSVYIGYDINGKILYLLTDFALFAWWNDKPI
jgi:hypothetical protein